MIGYLTGKIISSKPTKIIVDAGGVGYVVNISINTFEKISEKESDSRFIHTVVREDAITLFGFYTESEKEMFEHLITVNGIGHKLAISLLSGIQTSDLKCAVQSGDVTRIVALPGIGRKTAERLVLELRSKVDSVADEGTAVVSVSKKNEAVLALTTLGYNSKTAEAAVRNILNSAPELSLEELIKRALGDLNR